MFGKVNDSPSPREMVLVRSEPVKPQEILQVPAKVFCAERNAARDLLKRILLMIGAMKELENGGVAEEQIKILAVRMQEFLLGFGEQLMIDTGMSEATIVEIAQEIQRDLKKPRS